MTLSTVSNANNTWTCQDRRNFWSFWNSDICSICYSSYRRFQ